MDLREIGWEYVGQKIISLQFLSLSADAPPCRNKKEIFTQIQGSVFHKCV